jgi:cyclase
MKSTRVIARLDVKGPNLVKGIHLEGLRVIGDPRAFARHYYESGIDEILYQDVVASLYDRNGLADLVSAAARDAFVPITVGGGLRTVDDIRTMLRAGADKVSLNSAALKNPEIICEGARAFGSSTIVVAIECVRHPDGTYQAYYDNGREASGKEVLSWARQVESLGAGEVLITSVDRDGTGRGVDLDLIGMVSRSLAIPVIAHGGVGNAEHAVDAVTVGSADAIAVASVFHYEAVHRIGGQEATNAEGNREFVKSGRGMSQIESTGVAALKRAMAARGVHVRPAQ